MSIWIGAMQKHLEGHKGLTDHNDIVRVDAGKFVYIPLMSMFSTNIEVLVKEGDSVKVGTMIAKRSDHMTVPFFSSVSGKVVGKQTIMHAVLKPLEHLVIENDGLYEKEQPFSPIDFEKATREELVDFMMNAGIVGCGGAGFPTYMKYKNPQNISTLIINAVECEPYITADYREISNNIDDLVLGVKAMLKLSTAKEAWIAIKSPKKELIAKVRAALVGVSGIVVKEVPDVYPMGWERTLVYQLLKKRYDRLPSEIGCIVNNATTAIAFAKAIRTGMPIVEKTLTFSGNGIKTPANVSVPVGVKTAEIVAKLGGYASEDVLLIAGGPMMGKTIPNDQFVVTPYGNAVTILKTEKIDSVACLRCGRCNDTCPAGLLPVRINNAEQAADLDTIVKLRADQCIECGLCTYVCPSKLDVAEGVRRAKRILQLKKK
ncbi:MAG: electron transporter RnfC [Firmicutes bacterium GWF2_51_9]|nr:RnfABCDGE type electron transport complex subunit C [Erysipelotrichaceae bacterium]OGS53389.1 MAG: electron transporter RnfC [Firmicutes bacterium GWF2_51_9]OGS59228.1 MAG: electron transporter RnfC [Firmicutes bacterium GWE2_51_13]HAM64087.1 electron transporter RnfC [Erysipelotrichaceae bacterium]HAO60371.1 electron transporter RnfC [Erysipelotrichaceae bacterium]